MYQVGEGVPQDDAAAAEWVVKAAAQGQEGAQHSAGSAYERGAGVPQDSVEAARWHRLAAGQGNVASMLCLATMHRHGNGVEKDDVAAKEYFYQAAAKGHPVSRTHLPPRPPSLYCTTGRQPPNYGRACRNSRGQRWAAACRLPGGRGTYFFARRCPPKSCTRAGGVCVWGGWVRARSRKRDRG